jgi:mannose-6-phosphate isomerase-like protein (cupin superfamily)
MEECTPNLGVYYWTENGYQPLVFYDGWQVALLNWEPAYDLKNAGDIECHEYTDEVFVLWKGHGLLLVSSPDGLRAVDMLPGVIYNVPHGVWHTLLATRDVSWVIVESRDTHLNDTHVRRMTNGEWQHLRASLPEWVKE